MSAICEHVNTTSAKRSFWFHYNKPASQAAGAPRVTLHWKGRCLIVANVDVRVPTRGRLRKTQPRFVMAGEAREVEIDTDGVAVVR